MKHICPLVLFLCLCFPTFAWTDPGGVSTKEAPAGDIWVTMGEDAFDALARRPGLLSDLVPPVAHDARAGVVITRLPSRDLPVVSSLFHEEFRRCAGFVVHPSLDDATATLDRLESRSLAKLTTTFQIGQEALVDQLLPELLASEILGTMSHLSTNYTNRYYENTSGEQAALWIRDTWANHASARGDVTVETYAHSFVQPSVILTIPGVTLPDEIVVLGGHLDSIQSGATNTDPATVAPGADDDGSGIAVLTEVIRVLLANGFTPDRTVRFMGYAAEEVGLVGSGEIAGAYETAGTNVVAVLQLDMTDYQGSVEDIVLVDDYTDPDLNTFLGSLVDHYLPDLQWTTTTCGYGCSDHASWTNHGYSAAFPFEARFGDHNPQIHTVDDTLDTVGNSADHALKFAQLATAFAVETALLDCSVDADCDDGLYCNGTETCSSGVCQAGADPCGGGACDDSTDTCTSICGDGTCDTGEDCNSCSADCPSYELPTASCGNGLCEAGDGEDCVSCPSDCNGEQKGKPSNRFCCGFGGTNPVGCNDSACTTGGYSCTEDAVGDGGTTCCGDSICEDPETSLDCAVDCSA